MKSFTKLLLFTFFLFISQSVFATICVHSTATPIVKTDINLTHISVKDYQKMVGKKMTLRDKIIFRLAKNDLLKQKDIIDRTSFDQTISSYGSDFNLGGFLLGFILNIIGVLIALLFGGNVLKWAWKGFWISVLVWLIGILIGRN